MEVLSVRNVHAALPVGLDFLTKYGFRQNSRNGEVLVYPSPVATVYEHPLERVIFWPERDANPFFHLYEGLWMLQGRNDVVPLSHYVKNMENYSDDGITLYGAYGYRWRREFGYDQLAVIINRLKKDPTDRRCVLSMWSPTTDLLKEQGKDIPCNLTVTFQISNGTLNMVVFNRSNDIVWGAYGANAVHFSMLLEYMAGSIGCQVGTYTQISVNYHMYLNVLKQVENLAVKKNFYNNPYGGDALLIRKMDLSDPSKFEDMLNDVMYAADCGFKAPINPRVMNSPFFNMVCTMLRAYHIFKNTAKPECYTRAIDCIVNSGVPKNTDWCVAGTEWLLRRKTAWEKVMATK